MGSNPSSVFRGLRRGLGVRIPSLTATILTWFAALGPAALPVGAFVRPGVNTVVLSGTPAPGLGGSILSSMYGMSIGPTGETTFFGYAGNTGVYALFAAAAPGDITLVGSQYSQAPGANPGVEFLYATPAPINAQGQVAVNVSLTGPGISAYKDQGTWLGNPALIGPVWMAGTATPLPSGLRFSSVPTNLNNYSPAFNDFGQVAFQTGLQTSAGVPIPNGVADWTKLGGQLFLVAQTDGPVAGLPPSATFTGLGTPSLNNAGMIVYSGTFNNPGGPVSTGSGVWLSTPGFSAPIALTGMALPQVGPDITFRNISLTQFAEGSNAHVNAVGQTAFLGQIQGTGVQVGVNDQGVWRGDVGSVSLVARAGDAAPGLPGGSVFTTFQLVSLANNGSVALLAHAGSAGAQQGGIWAGAPGDLHRVAYVGDTVSDGAFGPATIGTISTFAQNAIGEIAFQSQNGAIFGQDQFGRLHVLARANDMLQVAPGDFRTISSVALAGGNVFSGGPTPLNDHGQVVFQAAFTDGTLGLFISNELVPLAGDANADGIVNGQDIAQVASNWLTTGVKPSDVNFDGIINGQDIALIASNWLGTRDNAATAEAAAVPEPSGLIHCALAAAGLAAASWRRRQHG